MYVYVTYICGFYTQLPPRRSRRLVDFLSFSFPDINLTRFQSKRVALIFDLSSLNNGTQIQINIHTHIYA